MRIFFCLLWLIFSFLMFLGCCKSEVLERMENIKIIGNEQPELALVMLDSLDLSIRNEGGYVQKKYDLLKIRLSDKSDRKASSDIKIVPLIKYFEENGDKLEKQEVYYYAGSVYRDLNDTPRALEYFHKSEETAEKNEECDSMMLRNTYSQLHVLYYYVQDYHGAYKYAWKEYAIFEKMGKAELTALNHMGTSLMCLDSIIEAEHFFIRELLLLENEADFNQYADNIYALLYDFSLMKDTVHASVCFELSKKLTREGKYADRRLSYGEYYTLLGKNDSARIWYEDRLEKEGNVFYTYDAAKSLFKLYKEEGNLQKASHYATLYMDASDTLDLGRRQELAAITNNQYQYHLDKNKEMRLTEENRRNRFWLFSVSTGAVVLMSIFLIYMLFRKNRHLKEIVRITDIADSYKSQIDELQNEISETTDEIIRKKNESAAASADLSVKISEIAKIEAELKKKEQDLERNKELLAEKIEQNRSLLGLIHKAEFEKNSKEIISAVKQSSLGLKDMTHQNWEQLYSAVDKLYPEFKSSLTEKIGRFTEQQMQVCYLLKIGLSNTKIINMTGIPRTTLWRWVNKYSWIFNLDETNKKSAESKR